MWIVFKVGEGPSNPVTQPNPSDPAGPCHRRPQTAV